MKAGLVRIIQSVGDVDGELAGCTQEMLRAFLSLEICLLGSSS